jgi:two-component system chemotaxis response regulator CheB
MKDIKNIIVIGASAGGFKAISELVNKIPPGLPVAMFVVIHLSKNSLARNVARFIQKHTSYTCTIPHDYEEIKTGYLYIAPPQTHLFIKKDLIRLTNGPHENRWRPSADVLFRSAAVAYGPAVIGIILTGMMDDGTSGMFSIKRCGGVCIVQDPDEAEFDDMPVSALANVDIDHRAPIAEMGHIIADTISKAEHFDHIIPEEVKLEAAITERMTSGIEEMEKIATHSNYTCPDCGGGLWEIKYDPARRYRCHTGHVYTEKLLLEKQSEEMEESLWASIRMMEERRNLLNNIVWRHQQNGQESDPVLYLQRAKELGAHIDRLKALLVSVHKAEPDNDGYL